MPKPPPAPVEYRISFPKPWTHLFEVRMTVRGLNGDAVDLVMPAWAPGSYKIRDFAKHVQDLACADGAGRPLSVAKTDKCTWRVTLNGSRTLSAFYRVYANELTVQTSHLDDTHAYFNGTSLFLYADGLLRMPHRVRLDVPKGWRTTTGLEPVPGLRHVYEAPDYDVLVDCPVEIGTHRVRRFEHRGVPHEVAFHGSTFSFPEAKAVADIRKIVAVEAEMFSGLPYRHYHFLFHLTDGAVNGLEHLNSTTIRLPHGLMADKDGYDQFLYVTSHEFFHLWNVKRIRSAVLGPFDYKRENYTKLLWVHEGLTSFYDELFICRAGIKTPRQYLDKTCEHVERVQNIPGRLRQPLSASSFDTWIKLYQPDENTPNDQMSYYEKGQLVGLLLDLEIRGRTRNRRSLDDVMRHLWTGFGRRGQGFPEEYILPAVNAVAGVPFDRFFADFVDGTKELDYDAGLAHAGLRLVKKPKEENGKPVPPKAWMGILTEARDGRIRITSVVDGAPAAASGLNAFDELVAIDGARIAPPSWPKPLDERKPGQTVEFTVFRHDRMRKFRLRLGRREQFTWKIEKLPKATPLQKAVFKGWVKNGNWDKLT